MLLARELGWLSSDAFTPHMKRIPMHDNLAIGVEFLPTRSERGHCCRIVDGAIASGATVITLMEMFSSLAGKFEIYTVHCTEESVNALTRYGRLLHRDVIIFAGFVGGVLNSKFYAVEADNPSILLVGDVGDTIAPIMGGA
jgi:uracil phosphoribosyltransferase